MILVKPRLFVCIVTSATSSIHKIYCIDIVNGRVIKSGQIGISDVGRQIRHIGAYDEQNQVIYLLSEHGKDHKSISVKNLVPSRLWKEEIIYGYIRSIEDEYELRVASALYDIIRLYCSF